MELYTHAASEARISREGAEGEWEKRKSVLIKKEVE